ncbi:MAG: 50S ribosomal protein L10, partial [Chloroflexi bacterium]|nr:50S ribosomal protein L10 [Chloroflexota bacterium]
MPITRERKEELVAEYTDLLERSQGVFITEYSGMNNAQMTELRGKVREQDGIYKVTKLTLFKIALENAGYPQPDNLSGAPLAVAFSMGDLPPMAKALLDYAKDNDLVEVRGGILPGASINLAQVKALSDMPPIEEIRASLLGIIVAPSAGIVNAVEAARGGQLVNVLQAAQSS